MSRKQRAVSRKHAVPGDVDPVLHDPVGHLAGQVEDGVLVRLHRLGRVDHEDQGRVQHL